MRSPFPNPSLRVVALGGLSAFVLWSHGYAASTLVKVPPSGPSLNEAHPAVSPLAIAGAGSWIFIKLPRLNYEPLAAAPNGVVLLRNTDHPLQFLRWRAGETLALGPEATFERMTEINEPSAANGTHIFDSYAINTSGVIALAYTYSSVTAASSVWDQYIRVWDPADAVAKLAQGEIDRRIAWDGAAGPAVALGIARHSRLAAVNNRSDTLGNFVAGQFTHTPTHSGDPIPWISSHRILAQSRPVDDPVEGANVNSWFGADLVLTGLNSNGQHIGYRLRTGINAAVIAGVVEFQNVDFSPAFIGETGMVLGRTGLGDFRAFAAGEGAEIMYSTATRTQVPLPTDGRVTWVDELDRPNGYAPDGSPAVWTPLKGPGGLPLSPVQYIREAYVPLPVPRDPLVPNPSDDWQINPAHYIPPNAMKSQLGVMRKGHTTQPFLAIRGGLVVDANRDGVIERPDSDLITTSNPFRFWINDDDDNGDDKRSAADDISLPESDRKRDSENTKVDGIRDLEDFFPVYFDIKQLLTVLPRGTNGISYYLRHEDSALGVVFTSYTRAQAFEYLRGSPTGLDTGFGPALIQKAGDATVTKVTAAGVDISAASTAFFDRIENNDGGVLLVEASKTTTKPLVLEVRKGSVVIAELKLELKIDLVETMFHYVNLRSFAHGTPIASNNQGPGYGSTTPTAAPNDPFAEAASRKNLVFVHGYNVNGEGARGSAATAFKRFYWSGSKASFYALLWRGDDGQGAGVAPAGATPDYHRNVGHAWQQGPLFRDFLGTLEGDTAIMAHSLGNGVTKVALTRAPDPNNPARLVPASKPTTVKHYFAVDSALPLEATSASDITSESKNRMRHSWWAEYDSQERLWPTHWHELFAGTGDGREGLTWQNVFANLEVGTNFYSSGEEVLANPLNDVMPVWEPLFFAGLRAWVAQEKHKGGNGLAASFFRSWTAGWVENKEWYQPIVPTPPTGSPQKRRRFASEAQNVIKPSGVPTSALAAEPFFQRFQSSESGGFYPGYQGSRLHAPVGDTNADDEARKLVTVAKVLGEAIPALSYPQGSNTATKFDDLSGNFDLNTSNFKNGWPTSRGGDTNWKHSDCLDVSYIYHFKFYDRMKTDGGLQ